MPSEIPYVPYSGLTAAFTAMFLICLFSGAVSADAGPAKNKPVKASKPVFSVSVHDSAHASQQPPKVPAEAPVLSGAGFGISDTASHAADTARHVVKAAKDSAPAAQKQWTVQKKAADTLKKIAAPAIAQQSSAPPASLSKKQKQQKTSWVPTALVRALVLLLCAAIILAAIRFVKKQKAAPRFLTTTRLSVMDKEVQRACRYIEKNFADPDLSVKNICMDLITGEAFLEALMERDLGVTVSDFIMHVRINGAKQILAKDPSMDGEAVARDTGFPSAAAFLTVFRKLTGVPFEAYTQRINRKNG